MKHLVPLTLLAFALSACQAPSSENDEAYQKLLEENRRQMDLAAQKDSTVNAMMASFNQIHANLKQVREKQGGLQLSSDAELEGSSEDQIMAELRSIDELMEQNRNTVAQLRSQLKGNDLQLAEMALAIENLNTMVEERDAEILMLEEELVSTNSTLGTLIDMYRDQSQLVEHQEDELNTAFYVYGTKKELKEQGILSKDGGFAGIGGKNRISGDVDLDLFKKIDITKDTQIILKVKQAEILTTHPTGSYELKGEGEQLDILDPEKFWSMSKYLVIAVDQ